MNRYRQPEGTPFELGKGRPPCDNDCSLGSGSCPSGISLRWKVCVANVEASSKTSIPLERRCKKVECREGAAARALRGGNTAQPLLWVLSSSFQMCKVE